MKTIKKTKFTDLTIGKRYIVFDKLSLLLENSVIFQDLSNMPIGAHFCGITELMGEGELSYFELFKFGR